VSKKKQKKVPIAETVAEPEALATVSAAPLAFGADEMLGELESIVAEAEVRQAQDASLM
jgi:hypothetical protein